MVITESQMGFGNVSGLNLLNNMTYLTEAESVYAPAMVPVIESQTYGAHLIRLEDMINFAESNGIDDLGYALSCVCEASEIDPSTVAFTVQAENVIADPEIASLVRGIMNEGVSIAAIPANPNSAACMSVDLAMDRLLETGSPAMLNALAYDDWDTYFQEAENAAQSGHDVAFEGRNAWSKSLQDKRAKDRENIEGSVSKIWDKVKSGANIGRDWLAKQFDRLNKWMRKIQDEIAKTPEKDRGVLQKLKGFIAKVLEVISRKIHNFVQANRGNINTRDNPLDSKK